MHSDEHLTTTDQGVVMVRRYLQRQLDAVAQGRDPAGVSHTEAAAYIEFDSGNFVLDRTDKRMADFLAG